MKITFIIACLLSFNQLIAQQLDSARLLGDWTCKAVLLTEDLTAEEKSTAETMKEGFLNVRFIFRPDGIFNLKLPKTRSPFMNELDFLNNKKWLFNHETQMISIGTHQENLMHIYVKEGSGFLTFLIFETPLSLRMEKI
jgi:hypothetical protein